MNVALLTNSISHYAGGLSWAVRSLSKSLVDEGIGLRLFSGKDIDGFNDLSSWGNIPVELFPLIGPRSFGFQGGMLRSLRIYDPDLLHIHGLWMYTSVASVLWSNRVRPYLISPHGMLDSWALRNSVWKKRLAGILYEYSHLKNSTCLHALCESELTSIRSFGLKNPVAIIPNGVDLPDLNIDSSAPYWEVHLPNKSKVLLYLGRLHPKKGINNLLQAWALLLKRGIKNMEEWHLVIAGWGDQEYENYLKRLVYELDIERSVHFIGPQFDLQKEQTFRRANAFILPSFSEGLPMAVLEAWSYKLPALITPHCNIPEGFNAGAAVKIMPSVESLVENLATLFSMDELELNEMGSRGRLLVEHKFDWRVIGREMANVYDWIASGKTPPSSIERC